MRTPTLAILLLWQVVAPAPKPIHYQLTVTGIGARHFSGIGEGNRTDTLRVFALLSLTTTDTAGRKSATVAIDSVAIEVPELVKRAYARFNPLGMGDTPRNTFFHVVVQGGTIRSVSQSTPMTQGSQAAKSALPFLFPGFETVGMSASRSWTDTIVVDTTLGGVHGTSTKITHWTLVNPGSGPVIADAQFTESVTTAVIASTVGTRNASRATGHRHLLFDEHGDLVEGTELTASTTAVTTATTDVTSTDTTRVAIRRVP